MASRNYLRQKEKKNFFFCRWVKRKVVVGGEIKTHRFHVFRIYDWDAVDFICFRSERELFEKWICNVCVFVKLLLACTGIVEQFVRLNLLV